MEVCDDSRRGMPLLRLVSRASPLELPLSGRGAPAGFNFNSQRRDMTSSLDMRTRDDAMGQDTPSPSHDTLPPPSNAREPFPWHLGICDAHCHPTDAMASMASLATMRAAVLAVMATRSQDQHLVAAVAASHGVQEGARQPSRRCRVVPSFGWHPWFSHQLYDDAAAEATYKPPGHGADEDAVQGAKKAHYEAVLAPAPDDDDFIAALPTPVPLSSFTAATRARLQAHPCALVGEIGLDKAFRLPRTWDSPDAASRDDALTPGGREGRLLSPHRVRMPHQRAVLQAQLRLAGAHGRPVSVHGVQAHGVLYDAVSACWEGSERHVPSRREKRIPYPPRICLHSFSGGVEMLKQWMQPSVPAKVFVSLSTAVNLGTDAGRARFADVVRAVPDARILVESDLHVAGADMDAALEDMYRRVCEAKGWGLDEGVARIGRNFAEFVFGRPRR
ncbi:TatD deoxyribonuclease family protein [Tolypocladium paradoxum]|uniref:TatD deoxyribonuclease family protein n=1 Tax=Tolypocladium paradoxum TaxID=94208 RepID=A0A2S4KWX6_9HYPO|nr:TatD deoxyribonuclease family protein [Tolypocladium paradoxum]